MRALLSYFPTTLGEMIRKIYPWLKFGLIGVFATTRGLAIPSILFRILRICRSLFKYNYLKNRKHFLSVLFHLWTLHQILNISKKKKIVIANVFPKLQPSRTWLDHSLKTTASEHSSTVNMLKVPKHLWNLHESTFIIFFHHSEEKWFRQYLPDSPFYIPFIEYPSNFKHFQRKEDCHSQCIPEINDRLRPR